MSTAQDRPEGAVDEPPRRPRSSVALVLLTSGGIALLLYVAHSVFIPIALSVLFALLLSRPVEALHRRGLPRSVGATLILIVFVVIIGGTVNLLWDPAQQWLAAAPRTTSIIQKKLGPASRIMQRLEAVTSRAGHITDRPGTITPPSIATPQPASSEGIFTRTREALISLMTVIILTLFLLASGPPVLARMTAAFASRAHATRLLGVIEAIRSEVGRYYAMIALINLGLAIATWGAMTLLGMPNPVLWGVMAGILNFIPYVGSATTLVVLSVVAFVSFDGVGRALGVAGTFLALTTVEGQIVQPLFLGQRLELNPVLVFLALWVGGWFWGIAGIVLAIPCLVAVKVAAKHHPRGGPLVDFMSPGRRKRVKQRELAPAPEPMVAPADSTD